MLCTTSFPLTTIWREQHAALAINADILSKDEQILKAARSGEKQGLSKTAADVNRAETEVSQRKVERTTLEAQAAIASARLVQLLVLDPKITLVPADQAVTAIRPGPKRCIPRPADRTGNAKPS